MRAGAVFNAGRGHICDMLEEPGEPQVLVGLRVQRDRLQLGTANLREPGRLGATAGSKQIHRTVRYVKVCPPLSLFLSGAGGTQAFLFFPAALMQPTEGNRRPRGLAPQASAGPRDEEEEEEGKLDVCNCVIPVASPSKSPRPAGWTR